MQDDARGELALESCAARVPPRPAQAVIAFPRVPPTACSSTIAPSLSAPVRESATRP